MIPMEMTTPSQGMNSNILAGLTGDILKKVTKNITETMSDHATQAIQQGVPYGHILEQLIKMSPVSAGAAVGQDLAALPNSGKPPDNPMMSGGRKPQPPNPGGGVKQDDSQVAQAITGPDNATLVPSQQTSSSANVSADGNTILSQLLAAMQNGNGQQANIPSFLGIKPSAQNQVLLTEVARNQQALAGKTPMQIGDLQKIIAGVGGEQLSANTVPLNAGQRATKEYQDREIAAKGAELQLSNAKEQMSALNQEQERATSEFNAMANSRGWLAKGLTPKEMISQYKAKLDDIGTRMDQARQNLVGLAEKHPVLQQNQKVNSKQLIGQTIGKYKVIGVK